MPSDEDDCIVCDVKLVSGDSIFGICIPIQQDNGQYGQLQIKAHKKCWARYANLKRKLGQKEVRL